MDSREEKTIYELFRISILLKGLGSAGEMLAGALIVLVPSSLVLRSALVLTQGDVDGTVEDFLARVTVQAAHSFAISNHWLIGIYIFVRGMVQGLLVIALLRNRLWAYPLLFAVLLLLVLIQSYEVYLSHSFPTAFITFLDAITAALVWHEYGIVRAVRKRMLAGA